jgi:hypothetical protein
MEYISVPRGQDRDRRTVPRTVCVIQQQQATVFHLRHRSADAFDTGTPIDDNQIETVIRLLAYCSNVGVEKPRLYI